MAESQLIGRCDPVPALNARQKPRFFRRKNRCQTISGTRQVRSTTQPLSSTAARTSRKVVPRQPISQKWPSRSARAAGTLSGGNKENEDSQATSLIFGRRSLI